MTTAVRTDAQPVRDHIRSLHAAGFTDRRIARIAGLATETVISFTRPINRTGNRRGVKRTCHPDVAAKILAVNAEAEVPGLVDANGSRRRVQALVAKGWPMEQVARRVGISGHHMRFAMTRKRIYGSTAHSIAKVYDELKNQQPERHGIAKWEAEKARKRAHAKRWPNPKYWAERMDVIDDPDFEPMYGITRREIVAQDASEVIRLCGLDRHAAAERLGVTKSYIDHAFREYPQYAIGVAA